MTLAHSPADITRYLLVQLGLGSLASSGSWPTTVSQEPDTPDNHLALWDIVGRIDGRYQTSGEVAEHYGVKIGVRAISHVIGAARALLIADSLAPLANIGVPIGSHLYVIQAVTRTGGIIYAGTEPNSFRHLFTINLLVALRQIN